MGTPLEKLQADSQVQGLLGKETVRIVSAQMMGEACQVVVRDAQGNLHSQILFRDQEAQLELITTGRKWSFEGIGEKFRLVSEADRIRLAYLFDPYVNSHYHVANLVKKAFLKTDISIRDTVLKYDWNNFSNHICNLVK